MPLDVLCSAAVNQIRARPNDPPLQEQTEFKLLSSIVYVISVTVDYSLCRNRLDGLHDGGSSAPYLRAGAAPHRYDYA